MNVNLRAAGLGVAVTMLLAVCRPAVDPSVAGLRGGDFTLTSHEGKRVRLSDTRGRVRVLFFGFASCPDVCPTTLTRLVRVRELLGDAAAEFLVLFVSVDPDRDTPEALRSYLGYFKLDALGLTGTKAEIDAVGEAYGASYEIEPSNSAAGPNVGHTTELLVIGPDDRLVTSVSQREDAEAVAAAIRRAR